MTLSKKNTLIIKEQKKNKNNKMGSLDKRKIITQIIIFNILWFICGVLILEYLSENKAKNLFLQVGDIAILYFIDRLKAS